MGQSPSSENKLLDSIDGTKDVAAVVVEEERAPLPVVRMDKSLPLVDRRMLAVVQTLDRNASLLPLEEIRCLYDGYPRAAPVIDTVLKGAAAHVPAPYNRRTSQWFGSSHLSNDLIHERLLKVFDQLDALFQIADGHLMAAGGSVVAAMRGHGPELNAQSWGTMVDVDLFLYGCSESDATRYLTKMVEHLKPWQISLVRGSHHVTVVIQGRIAYQFILRIFGSPLQVLQSFDLSVCKAGYSPSLGLVATESCAFSVATSVMVVDPCLLNRGASSSRISKYAARNYLVVFPSSKTLEGKIVDDHLGSFVFGFGRLQLHRVYSRAHQDLWPQSDNWLTHDPKNVGILYSGAQFDASRPKEEIGEYGASIYEMGQLMLFNFRKARDGDLGLNAVGASMEELLSNPQIVGHPTEAREYFDNGNFLQAGFLQWPELNSYTLWDIDERFDKDRGALLIKFQQDYRDGDASAASKVAALIDEMRCLIMQRLSDAKEIIQSAPLWDDVSAGPLCTPPWSGYLCGAWNECEFYGPQVFHPLPEVPLAFEHAMTIHLLRTRSPLWMSLPRDVFAIIRGMFVAHMRATHCRHLLLQYFL